MASPESLLRQAAADGSFDLVDPEAWPKTLQYILDRMDENYSDFPKPPGTPAPEPLTPSSSGSLSPPGIKTPRSGPGSPRSQEAADKENAVPTTPPRPDVPAFSSTSSSGIPQELVTFYSSIRTRLSKNFADAPPHTLQRLAELILDPKRHYRFLPQYLRALDRVVSVTSRTTRFPLPVLPSANTNLLNGGTSTPTPGLGSDESLGGALLTPIPWLQNRAGSQSEMVSESTEMVEGPNGAGRIETVSVVNGHLTTTTSTIPLHQQQQPQPQPQAQIASPHPDGESLPSTGAVTQGEILRQEQEAGVLLSNPHSLQPNRSILAEVEGTGLVRETVEGEEEQPHARGPEIIGMEDTGPQRAGLGLDIEGAVGRPSIGRASRSPQPPSAAAEAETKTEEKVGTEKDSKDEEMKDTDDKDEELKDEGDSKDEKDEAKTEEKEKEDDDKDMTDEA